MRDSGGKYTLLLLLYCHIGLLFGKRLDTNLYVVGFENIRILPSPHVIVEDVFFSTLESGMRVDRSRIREEKVADSKISRYMWRGGLRVSNLYQCKKS